ncbi:unnamed protein product [Sphenostylis stenocarpa]|uniref:YqaJ viral recombinase domain-containing protein n=1 Tax=Sphenostylis stenocarpa TaxID=92480 RepID=A0AA86SS96_9FABA|nr:unnamed protein product [Sphenostylis stenocarpa]
MVGCNFSGTKVAVMWMHLKLQSLGGMLKYTSVETYSVLQASCLQHWFKNWQALRRNKLTASTFAAAIGFWRRQRVQLWLEKIGAIEPFSGNLATCWSNIKEEEALERYKLITGNTVLFPEFQVYDTHPDDSWLAASPDGVIDSLVHELPSRGVLEIKCPYFDGDISKAFPWSRIPIHYIPQAQGLMEILGRDWMDFYVWTPNGSSLFRLHRDAEYWDVMKIALSDFWWKHVHPARELYRSNVVRNPLYQLRTVRPAPRHELCRDIVYKSKHIVANSKLLMREIHGKLMPPVVRGESLEWRVERDRVEKVIELYKIEKSDIDMTKFCRFQQGILIVFADYMEDSEQRKKRLKEMRVQADQAEFSGAAEGFPMSGSLSNPLIEAPSTIPSRDKSCPAPRFDFYTDPMSAFSANKRNNTSIQAAPDNFSPSVGGSFMAQYPSPHPESTNPQMTLPPFHVAAAHTNPYLSGPRGPAHNNFPFHPSSGGSSYPNPRFEPSGGPLYNSVQGIAHRPRYSANPSPGYRSSSRPSYSSNPSPGYRNSARPSYSPNPSPGYRSSPNPSLECRNSPSPGQWRGRGLCHNLVTSVSGRGSGRGTNFRGHWSNENAARSPNRFYKSSMVEDPWNHLEPKIWETIDGSSRISEKVRPWISKSTSTTGEGSSAASVKSSSGPSLAEYLAAAVNEAANDAENV